MNCADLAKAAIGDAVGSPTHITSAKPIEDGKPGPYCEVLGYVEPQVKFEVRLPLTNWTQRYLQTGCGGTCGTLRVQVEDQEGCLPAMNGELALASTDMGHSGGMANSAFGNDPQQRIDFAYRGVHVTALAAKALIGRFYDQPPKFSYFAGCSDGGREALMEVQRFPGDFDGVTAGAAAMNFTTQNTFYHGWNVVVNTGPDGKPILTADKLPVLHNVVLEQCDALDGLKDGLIGDPLACHPNLSSVTCVATQDTASCLTPEQAKVALEIYKGAHDAKGHKFVLSGPLPGSELNWAGVYVPAPGNDRTMSRMVATATLKYLVFKKNPPDSYTLSDFKFTTASFAEATQLHRLYDATDPDLTAFASRGGKLILWHGLADPHIAPLNTIAYYTAMEKIMGSQKVENFARLYLFPGGGHCAGGDGPFDFPLLRTIMDWVERGAAPYEVVASHRPMKMGAPGGPPSQPGGPASGAPATVASNQRRDTPLQDRPSARDFGKVDRTRPVYPYPLTTAYKGSGSVDDAVNFTAGKAQAVSPVTLEWMGSAFYSPH
jgi:feruloyl esterase